MRMVVRSNSMMRKMMQFMMLSDWTKALAVWLVAPWFVLVLLLSALNQWIRVHVRRALMVDKERALRLTKRVHERLQRTRSWNWTVVLRRVVLIGLVYLCAQVLVRVRVRVGVRVGVGVRVRVRVRVRVGGRVTSARLELVGLARAPTPWSGG